MSELKRRCQHNPNPWLGEARRCTNEAVQSFDDGFQSKHLCAKHLAKYQRQVERMKAQRITKEIGGNADAD